ncbi:MAG: c(7)-type cytochrome triheme domain-containing protein [Nitrospirota bacterium]
MALNKKEQFTLFLTFVVVLILGLGVKIAFAASNSEFMWGNIVLDNKAKEMKDANVNLVVYPHWMHRILFRCKVCHYTLVIDKKGGNNITMDKIAKGEACGRCHDGRISFDTKQCNRCHSLRDDQTLEGAKYTTKTIFLPENSSELKKIAEKIGAVWKPEKLGGDKEKDFPRDKFGFINWVKLIESGAIKPIHSLDPKEKDETRDTKILFQVLGDFEDNVLFPHPLHTFWVKCEQCHKGKGKKPMLFKPVLGSNRIRMRDQVKNQNFCIHCHGRVSFPAANCTGCHKFPRDYKFKDKNVIIREELPDAQ